MLEMAPGDLQPSRSTVRALGSVSAPSLGSAAALAEVFRDPESWEECEPRRDSGCGDSNDFFLSAMVKEELREAGRPQLRACRGELVSRGCSAAPWSVALLLLPALMTFCLLTASTEFFLSTRGLSCCCSALAVLLFSCCLSLEAALGEAGGVQLRQESEERPEETALSLSESGSVLSTVGPSSEFFLPMGGL